MVSQTDSKWDSAAEKANDIFGYWTHIACGTQEVIIPLCLALARSPLGERYMPRALLCGEDSSMGWKESSDKQQRK